uniref:Superoxide dismutase copper/zinc binding domain-containing protein n=1 Tax=Salmo trutta TaxID=8032 RepID=A0A674DAE3_SALTR
AIRQLCSIILLIQESARSNDSVLCQEADSKTEDKIPEVNDLNGTLYATCDVKPSRTLPRGQPKVHGQVLFKQSYPDCQLPIMVYVKGFPNKNLGPPINVESAIHIHRYRDLNESCDSAGPHFNPQGGEPSQLPGRPGPCHTVCLLCHGSEKYQHNIQLNNKSIITVPLKETDIFEKKLTNHSLNSRSQFKLHCFVSYSLYNKLIYCT